MKIFYHFDLKQGCKYEGLCEIKEGYKESSSVSLIMTGKLSIRDTNRSKVSETYLSN